MTKKKVWNKGKKLSATHRQKVIKTLTSYTGQLGKKNLQWKGGRVIQGGYIKIKNYTHPFRTKNNYYPEHRLVMEKHLGKTLLKNEHVHHKDGNKLNNQLKNLVVMTNSAHVHEHRYREIADGTFFAKRPNFGSNKRN